MTGHFPVYHIDGLRVTAYTSCDLGCEKGIPESDLKETAILHWTGLQRPWMPEGLTRTLAEVRRGSQMRVAAIGGAAMAIDHREP